MKKKIKEHLVGYSVLVTVILGGVLPLIPIVISVFASPSDFFAVLYQPFEGLSIFFIFWFICGAFFIYPVVLTAINFCMMIARPLEEKMIRAEKMFECITVVLGVIYSAIFCVMFSEIDCMADWTETLYNSQLHSPIWTESYPTVITVAIVGMIGYLVLLVMPLKKMPPLVAVSSIAAMYLGTGECIIWIIQIQGTIWSSLFLSVLPFNCILITVKTVRRKVLEWNEMEEHTGSYYESNRFLDVLNRKLDEAETWPLAALIFMLPLLGIVICILVLFGQRPDAVIKAWTETSDWSLSQRVAPQNIRYDEHYLCTVAAGGHRKVVKPIRMGVRHGHRVTVNRQLCIANAFEQILEERTPRFHKHVRHFYDTYGFPVARLIRSRYVADMVYFLMKPLEWIFLIVIYFCDVKPENRIAMQYLPKPE